MVRKWFTGVTVLVTLSCLISCSDHSADLKLEELGQQHAISWPSLARSPWPMNHANPQSTGRSELQGPLLIQSVHQLLTTGGSLGGVSVTVDSAIVLGADVNAFALNDSLLWTYRSDGDPFRTTPIVRSDGVVLSATQGGWVHAFQANGTLAWQVKLSEDVSHQGSTLGIDGTFYCIGTMGTLFAVSRDGQLSWSLNDPMFSRTHRSVLTFSPDGSTLYVPGTDVALNAVDVVGRTVRWRFGAAAELWLAPMVDSQGNIYVMATDPPATTEPSLMSVRPDGTLRWSFAHGNRFNQVWAGDPTIDAQGNIYFALDTLYSVDWRGKLRWKRPLDKVLPQPYSDVPLVCDAAGRVYAIVGSWANPSRIAVVFTSEGDMVGQQVLNSVGYSIDSSPAIYWDYRLAVCGYKNSQLYILR